MSLPSVDDLFRPTEEESETAPRAVHAVPDSSSATTPAAAGVRRPSGRVRHDEKMTVYVTAGELVEIEQTRLSLRAEHGLAVDRGRLVREALALVLAEYEARGPDSALVRRLDHG